MVLGENKRITTNVGINVFRSPNKLQAIDGDRYCDLSKVY